MIGEAACRNCHPRRVRSQGRSARTSRQRRPSPGIHCHRAALGCSLAEARSLNHDYRSGVLFVGGAVRLLLKSSRSSGTVVTVLTQFSCVDEAKPLYSIRKLMALP